MDIWDKMLEREAGDFTEITLHGSRELQEKRVKVLTEIALTYRIKEPETYLLLRNIGLQIQDQLFEE